MQAGYLKKVYETRDADDSRNLYDEWSQTYDAEVREHGYVTPQRCAEALAAHLRDQAAPILDYGCGTGLSGRALKLAGFSTIDGVDLSAEMLAQARRKDIYRDLHEIGADSALPPPGTYPGIAAVGVIGSGTAPVDVLHKLLFSLGRGGKLVFSFNDHTLEDPSFEAALNEWLDCGAATLLFKEYGPHLPGMDLKSNVYIVEKN